MRFLPLTLRLYGPSGEDDDFVDWEDLVGFVNHWRAPWPVLLGQDAFLKRFTVTMSRYAQALAIEDGDVFDSRFPTAQTAS